jgi:hypothetical protein
MPETTAPGELEHTIENRVQAEEVGAYRPCDHGQGKA